MASIIQRPGDSARQSGNVLDFRQNKPTVINRRRRAKGQPGAGQQTEGKVIDLNRFVRDKQQCNAQVEHTATPGNADNGDNAAAQAIHRNYFNLVGRHSLLGAAEEKILARAARRGDLAARNRLATANLRLVISIAKRYGDDRIDLMDLIGEGNLGLFKAIDKFDPDKGYRFSTYATWWIRDSVLSARMRQSGTVHIPIHTLKAQNTCLKAQRDLRQQLGREPENREVAEHLGKPETQVTKALDCKERRCSIESHCHSSRRPLHEILADDNNADPAELLEDENLGEVLAKCLGSMNERYRQILIKRFGLFGEQPRSVLALSNELGIRRATINKWLNNALGLLQSELQP